MNKDQNLFQPPVTPNVPNQFIIDGCPAMPVARIEGPIEGLISCSNEMHCCSHGSGPVYPCCRCGSTFRAR